ncbi:MAG: MmgE/PrpD family protein [Alphaproteobacteria bacterium]|nr:MmgE/PrpD family protein [Alphaproteobacteria bacterium]
MTAKAAYGVAALNLNLTRDLCDFLSRVRYEDLPPKAVHEAKRGLLDWIGCALAGSRHTTIDKLVAVLRSVGSQPQATVFGRGLKLGLLEAPIANGQMGHLLDFDDTHMGGVVLHASSPILSALFALGDRAPSDNKPVDGKNLIAAYIAGFEAGVRTGQASPRHHDGGWHLTGTLGTVAAGAAAGRLIGLDARKLTYALGIAATQAAGMQQNRGTSCKSLHAGKAGSGGVLAALLAEQGFDSSAEIIEGKRGFARIYSTEADPEALTAELGSRWEITRNGYKPYACGVVLHPLIDAVIAAAKKAGSPADAVRAIELQVHPHAVKITGVDDPQSGLMAKFSINHAAAVAYIDGNAGIAQFSDARAADPGVLALRRKIAVDTVESFGKDEARATVVTTEGARHEVHVRHASGTVANPMSDAALETKFMGNAVPVLGSERARKVVDLAWRLDTLADIRDIIQTCA